MHERLSQHEYVSGQQLHICGPRVPAKGVEVNCSSHTIEVSNGVY